MRHWNKCFNRSQTPLPSTVASTQGRFCAATSLDYKVLDIKGLMGLFGRVFK